MEFAEQRVVVMGGGSGIGLATARALAARGAQVVITGRDRAKLESAAASVDGAIEAQAVDATRRAELDAFFAERGRLDHLVLAMSAGAGGGPFRALDLATLRAGFEGKFWPHVQAAQAALPSLRADGSITFISSASAQAAKPGTAGLAAINAAIEALVPVLARELAPLRVNAVAPGVIDTPWWHGVPPERRQAIFAQAAEGTPAGRIGRPEDVAQVILLLIADTYVTGAVIPCDGGLRLG